MSELHRRVPAGQRRSAARLIAVQALYQLELAGGTPEAAILQAQEFAQRFGDEPDELELVDADPAMTKDLVYGVVNRCADIDKIIDETLSEERSVDRLDSLLRITLRAGTYELLHRPDIDPPVVINEYVDIAKAFFSNKEPALVNGVLDRLAQSLSSDEKSSAD
jgi:transcription antitermination protein NusB